MIIVIGAIIVLASVFGGFMWGGGHLVVLLHFNELLIIGGAAFGALVIMSPRKVLIDMANLPEQLAGSKLLTEDQKIGEVTRQFEAILLRQILESTQKTVIPSKFGDNSTTASIYHDLVTHQLADSISKSGTLGLAKSLQRELSHQLHPALMAGHGCQPEAQSTAHAGTSVTRPPSGSASHKPLALNLEPSTHGLTALTSHE